MLFRSMPLDAILRPSSKPRSEGTHIEAQCKIDKRSFFETLFDESAMRWTMRMIFHCEDTGKTRSLLYFTSFVGVLFGSIHCIAWQSEFPSRFEKIAWRTAAIVLIGACACIALCTPCRQLVAADTSVCVEYQDGTHYVKVGDSWRLLIRPAVWKSITTLLSVAYSVSRLSLLLLAILSIRDLPPSALKAVPWVEDFPHI